jgi:hypothetical protein
MKLRRALLAAATIIFGVSIASAQHTTSPLPKPPEPLPKFVRFPAPASQYDKYVQYYMTLLRSLPSRMGVKQGDVDVVILLLKDCASRIEADGIVTQAESKYCETITMNKVHERATPYMMQQMAGGAD